MTIRVRMYYSSLNKLKTQKTRIFYFLSSLNNNSGDKFLNHHRLSSTSIYGAVIKIPWLCWRDVVMMITGCLGLFVLFFCIILLSDQENNCTLFQNKNLWLPQDNIFSLKLFYDFKSTICNGFILNACTKCEEQGMQETYFNKSGFLKPN